MINPEFFGRKLKRLLNQINVAPHRLEFQGSFRFMPGLGEVVQFVLVV